MSSDLTPTATFAPAAVDQLDPQLVGQLVKDLESGSLEAVHQFGRAVGAETAQHADKLLEQVKSKDLDVMGQRLSDIVVAAKSLNLHSLSDQRSRIPLIGGLIDKVRLKGESVVVQFQDVKSQIDKLVGEVEQMQKGLTQRIHTMEESFVSVQREHHLLGAHIEAGGQVLTALQQQVMASTADAATADHTQTQRLADMRSATAALEKRLGDFRVLQHSALQQLPMIRMVQANNRMLVEKFYTIKELTIPAWKRQFTLALSLNEQRNAVDLAQSIDQATNDFLKENARLLHANTVATAKANQRLVIDVETLQQVHDTLMNTVAEVVEINREGIAQRNAATDQLRKLREDLTQRLGSA